VIEAVRRRTELGLVLLAGVITGSAYVLASLGRTASMPADIWPFLGIVLGLMLAAHLANRRLARAADGLLLPLAGLLNGIGYVFIARLDQDLAGLQSVWTAVGVGAYVATLLIVRRTRDLEHYRYTFMLVGVALLLMPLLPSIGRNINGARIWVSIGPLNFQPGEFAKIVLAIFFASYLVEKREVLCCSSPSSWSCSG
jgi:peptidoglycan glycosyltransferase